MAKMVLMCGCSGSGKTTFAKKYAEENNLLYLGIDEFYAKVNGDECLHINTFKVWIKYFEAIHEAEINNIDCIVDTNAITKVHRSQFTEWFPTFEHHLIYIDAAPTLRKRNNLSRRRQIPESEMDTMTRLFEVPIPAYEDPCWKSITYIKNNDNNFAEPIMLKGN